MFKWSMSLPRYATVMLIVVHFVALSAIGSVVSPRDVASVISVSDLIVVGQVTDLVYENKLPLNLRNMDTYVGSLHSTVRVDRLVKGDLDGETVTISFTLPEHFLGLRSVKMGQYSIFFLRTNHGHWEFSDPIYPTLPAVPMISLPFGSPVDRVARVLGETVSSNIVTDTEKTDALDALRTLNTVVAQSMLHDAMGLNSGIVRLQIAAALVARNDVEGLSIVEQALSGSKDLPEATRLTLAGSLAMLSDPKAIPALSRLSALQDSEVRLNSAIALRQSGSPEALAPLAKLLYDSEIQVRYIAVAGLGEITHQDAFTPAIKQFQEHPQVYITHWTAWASANLH